MSVSGARMAIEQQVMAWEGVESHPHRFGGVEYRLGKRELGHIHDDHLVDIPFPIKVRDQIVTEGRAEPHHILPDSGWISFYLREQSDIARAVELFRLSYDLAAKQRAKRAASSQPTEETDLDESDEH
jgi:hypothetical protein